MATETTEAEQTTAGQAEGATGHLAEQAAESVGMPQLDFATFSNQIFWLVLTLIAIYLILSRVALPRIAAVLADRQGTITHDIVAAEELKQKAVEAEEIYNQALADARIEAQKIVAQTKAEIQAELDVATAKADAAIAVKAAESEKAIAVIREGALDSVKEVARDTAKEIVASLGVKADSRTVLSAVSARLKG